MAGGKSLCHYCRIRFVSKQKIMKSFYSPHPSTEHNNIAQLSSVAPVQRDAGAESLLFSCSPGAGAGHGDLSGVQQTSNKCGPVIIAL